MLTHRPERNNKIIKNEKLPNSFNTQFGCTATFLLPLNEKKNRL